MANNEMKTAIRRLVREQSRSTIEVADAIAGYAEPGLHEHRSAEAICDYLKMNGFTVEKSWPHMPTAFRAIAGNGKPRIGILAEYDALPDCGEKPGAYGHGCGHNLLGMGSAAAGVAAYRYLQSVGGDGRIVVWGCPAEEILAGKVYMARDGAFADNDAVLCWHPGAINRVRGSGGLALDSLVFEFFGKTAHAGVSPQSGRSALDGVVLLDVAANYLREHVTEEVRIHMNIVHGGDAPNVVPAYAKAWYYVRAKDRNQVDEVRKRLIACAKGAAMATGTRVKTTLLAGVYSRLSNDVLKDRMRENLELFGPNKGGKTDASRLSALAATPDTPEFATSIDTSPDTQGRGTSDEDNVSWITPLGGVLNIACVANETTGHHRELARQVVLPFAHKGMLRAAEILGATAVDLCLEPELLAKARKEFEKRSEGFNYDPLIPKRQKPDFPVKV